MERRRLHMAGFVFRSHIVALVLCIAGSAAAQMPNFVESTKEITPADPMPSAPLTFTLVIRNTGTATGNNVVVTDQIAGCFATFAFDPATNPSQVVVTPGPGTAMWNPISQTLTVSIPSIAAGAMETITITGISKDGSRCCNQALITSDEIPSPGQATDAAPGGSPPSDVTCLGNPDLPSFAGATMDVSPRGTLNPNDPLTYTLVFPNSGPGEAIGVSIRDIFPACIDDSGFDPAANPGQVVVTPFPPLSVTYNSPLLLLIFGRVDSGTTLTITITGLRAGTASSSCCNQATIFADELTRLGQATDDAPGGGPPEEPTCVEIAGSLGCDLLGSDLTFPPVTPSRTGPWVYTNTCAAGDERLDDTLTVLPTPGLGGPFDTPDDFAGSGGTLTLYQIDCDCPDDMYVSKNLTSGKVAVTLF